MIYPYACVDNFFINPDSVVEYSKKLNYINSDGRWPGKRSEKLHLVDKDFFNYVCQKMLAVLYPSNYQNIQYSCTLSFQKISPKDKGQGLIHTDLPVALTGICYLSKNENCGTSIYDYTSHYPNMSHKENNKNWKETIKFNSKYNRLILFDGHAYHGAQELVDEERLTLIAFFNDIVNVEGGAAQAARF